MKKIIILGKVLDSGREEGHGGKMEIQNLNCATNKSHKESRKAWKLFSFRADFVGLDCTHASVD